MARIVKSPDERRGELIEAARDLFFTRGYDNTSITDIVNAVGVAKGLFYYYFDSKQAALDAVVDELIDQSVEVIHEIVVDASLNALEKWDRALTATGNWKLEHKAEMLALTRMMMSDENVLLRHKASEQTIRMVAPEFAAIIRQGVDEGVFETEYADEAAEIIFHLAISMRETSYDVIINPGSYADPAAFLIRKRAAIVSAIERVLCAEPGSLSLGSDDLVQQWFAPPATAVGTVMESNRDE